MMYETYIHLRFTFVKVTMVNLYLEFDMLW